MLEGSVESRRRLTGLCVVRWLMITLLPTFSSVHTPDRCLLVPTLLRVERGLESTEKKRQNTIPFSVFTAFLTRHQIVLNSLLFLPLLLLLLCALSFLALFVLVKLLLIKGLAQVLKFPSLFRPLSLETEKESSLSPPQPPH